MEIDYFETQEEYVAQCGTGALLNPRIDSTFKALFTQDTKESKAALKSFLEAATGKNISKVKLNSNNAQKRFEDERDVEYDINVIFDDGEYAEIEMQAFRQHYDYAKRAEYQAARLATTYLTKGDDWDKIHKVYQISVLNFNFFPRINGKIVKEDHDAINCYSMRNEKGQFLANVLNVVFIELKRLKNYNLEKLGELDRIHKWALFLKDADNPQKQDEIKRLIQSEEGIMNANAALGNISATQDLWIRQWHIEKRERDRLSDLHGAQREARETGFAEGRAEGRAEVARSTAKSLIDMGLLTLDQISQATGLSVEELELL